MDGPPQPVCQPEEWREKIVCYFPNALSETYCVPPVHFNKVSYRREPVPGTEEEALVPEFTSLEGHFRSRGDCLSLEDGPEVEVPEVNSGSAACSRVPPAHGEPFSDSVKLITSVQDNDLQKALDKQVGVDVQSSTSTLGCTSADTPDSPVTLTGHCTSPSTDGASHLTSAGEKKKKKKKKKACRKKDASSPTSSSSLSATPAASGPQVSRQLPHCLFHKDDVKQLVRFKESDTHDDFAQNHVVTNLQALGKYRREPMFIVSQVSFGNYLNQPAYAAAVEQLRLNLPKDLDQNDIPYSRGEADFLLIHRRCGLLIGEVKSVGRSHAVCLKSSPDDQALARRITKGVTQLERARTVVRHLLSDVAPGITIRTTLALPYIRKDRLRRLLETSSKLSESLLKCLGASDVADAVDLCLCADQVSEPGSYWDVTPDSLLQLCQWWKRQWANDSTLRGPETDDIYLDIVARFVGPASTVTVNSSVLPRTEVRTTGQAVAEAGRRVSRLVLTPRQMDVLNQNQPRVCLNGPPGTGKTVLLVLQALRWLRLGRRVHVVSTRHQTFAACCLVQHQLLDRLQQASGDCTQPPASGACAGPPKAQAEAHERVPLLHYDFNLKESEVDRAVNDLLAAATTAAGGDLCVVMDEVMLRDSHPCGPRTQRMLSRLFEAVPDHRLFMWCACVGYVNVPQCLQSEELTDSLRCAPSVLRQVLPGLSRFEHVRAYKDSTTSAPCDGPDVIYVRHTGVDHEGQWPVQCQQCGKLLARTLAELGVADPKKSSLSWRDVFVVTRSDEVCDDVTDSEGRVTSRACGLVRGLRACEVPVRVLGEKEHLHDEAGWRRKVEEVARGGGGGREDQAGAVTVAVTDYVLGLERRVVVWAVGRAQGEDEGKAPEHAEANDRLFIVSRCTAQLVVLTPD